jgi:hypothetical protein
MLRLFMIIGIIILIVWLLGLFLHFIAGPLLWILLVIGIILLIIWLVQRVRIRKK